ncbi:MAG: apolipoprotein N-acyltransferase, partial [Sphingobium sp.]
MAARYPALTAVAIGFLSATGFAPLGLWPVTLLCMAALLWFAERTNTRKQAFLLGWCFGLGHFTLGNNWIAHAFVYQDAMPHWLGYFAVAALSLYLAVWPGLATLGFQMARARWPGLAATPLFGALWILTEYGRATLFTGFAWDPLGMIWLGTGLDQASRFIGTYGLSALAIFASGALLSIGRRQWRAGTPIVAALLAIGAWGWVRADHVRMNNESGAVARVTIVQPNINQNEKYDAALEQVNFVKLAELTGPSSPDNPRLIFWPEAALPAWLDMEPEWLERVAALEGPNDLLMTGGAKVYFREKDKGF